MVSHFPFMFGFARGSLTRLASEMRYLAVPNGHGDNYRQGFEAARVMCAEMVEKTKREIDARETEEKEKSA